MYIYIYIYIFLIQRPGGAYLNIYEFPPLGYGGLGASHITFTGIRGGGGRVTSPKLVYDAVFFLMSQFRS